MTRKKSKNYSKTTQKLAFSNNAFYCNCCDYLSSNNSNYKKHLRTNKHLENYSNFSKTSKSLVSVKNKFFCKHCDYSTSRKSNWCRHINSIKHMKQTSKNEQKTSKQDDALPSMEDYNNLLDEIETLKTEKISKNPKKSQKKQDNFDMEMLKSQINKIIESQNEIKNSKIGNTTINNYNNNNISINLFLDNYCSNAKSVQEFLKNVTFELTDIISNNLLIEDYLSKKLIKNLQDMPITERPIHCTDNKKKNFMVKDETSGWVQDNGMDSSGSLYNKVNHLQDKAYIEFFNEYDKANPLPHDTEKERIKCQISSDMITSKHKNNKNAIINIANTMSITEAMDGSLLNNKIND